MKKLFMYFALALTVLAMPAMAQAENIYGWTLDLSTYGAGTLTDIQYMSTTGQGNIYQDLGTDGVITAGDTFSVTSMLFTVTYTDGTGALNVPTFGGQQLYFYSNNLAGSILSVAGDGSFVYQYDSGDISMMLGSIFDVPGSTKLAELTLDWGLGDSTSENLGGESLQGQTDMGTQFITPVLADGLISFDKTKYPGLADNYPWLNTYLVFDLDNGLNTNVDFDNPAYYISPETGNLAFHAIVSTDADVTLVATPEPSTFLILGFGLLGLVGFRKKFKKA